MQVFEIPGLDGYQLRRDEEGCIWVVDIVDAVEPTGVCLGVNGEEAVATVIKLLTALRRVLPPTVEPKEG